MGRPMLPPESKLSRLLRYESAFNKKLAQCAWEGNCLIWPFGTDYQGRARITIGSTDPKYPTRKKYSLAASRYVMILSLGRDLDSTKECVLHTCDNVLCVNLEHLFLGTRDINNKDRARKGRSAPVHGEHNGNRKLYEKQAKHIKYSGESPTILSKHYGISVSAVYYIRQGKLWGHI